tara:strand:- start:246 stop:509 length:264 start_codon:yes stop_codon:yes gene_type:complete
MAKTSAQKYKANPASAANKAKYDKEYNKRPEQRAKRSELTTARRKAKKMGLALTGKDLSHTKSGGLVLEDSKKNRARNGHGKNGRLK